MAGLMQFDSSWRSDGDSSRYFVATNDNGNRMEFEHKVGALDDEDLVVGEKDEKNWKGIVISLLVIGSILGAIIIAIIICTPTGDVDSNRMKLEFEHVVSDLFKIQVFNGTWLSDHEIVYVDQNGSIVVFDADTNKSSSMLVKTYDKTLHTMAGFKLSNDRQSILFASDMHQEFGAPISARYAIFNISSQTVEFLDDFIKAIYPSKTPHIQYAAWGPNSNSIVFIESNDIYFVPDFAHSTSSAASGQPKHLQLTRTGSVSDGTISNGLPNSLYRTSIFSEPKEATMWWSADARYLAYLSFDDAQVEQTPIEYYDSYLHESNNNPKIHYERYPKAGAMNPRVSVHVVDLLASLSGGGDEGVVESSIIAPPAELLRQPQMDPRLGYYVTYVGWLEPQNQLLTMWSNRAQNSTILTSCTNLNADRGAGGGGGSIFGGGRSSRSSSAGSWKCDTLTTFSQRIPPSTDAKRTILAGYSANGTRLIFFALPRPDSIIGDHYHVAMLRGDERAPKYLTYGEFDIDRLISYDADADTLYFEVFVNENAERHLYKISSVGQVAARQTKCLTCQLEEPCGYNYAHIAPGRHPRYFVHECLGPSIPVTRMRSLSEGSPGRSEAPFESRHVLGSNQHIEQLVRSKQMPIEKFIAIKTNQQLPYDVHIKLYLPSEIEEEKDKRFPLLIESSEIDKRNVWKRFDLDWGKYLASRKQLIYARIDCVRSRPSGSSLASMSGASGAYSYSSASAAAAASAGAYGSSSGVGGGGGGLGEEQLLIDSPLFNAKDQIDVIKFMAENVDLFPYIDRRRIAIWGPTSTSAYVALATTINDDSKLIQCTVAVSPITNWRYMSSYTAEHYLGLPWIDSNKLKYERSNLLKRSYEFSMRKLLIIHGTADEQVHVQHSMQFIKSLTEHHMTGGVIHQMQLYPDVGHSLEAVKKHYYLTLDGFIDRCFYQKPITIKATEWKGKVRPKLY